MSDGKDQEDEETREIPKEQQLEEAMRDAVRAVEAREREVEVEVEAPSPSPPKQAAEAVTEAIIEAKHELESVLAQTQKETEHLRDKWMRSAADLENYKRRAQRERDEVVKFGNEKLLKDFLPIVDDIERAIEAIGPAPSEGTALSTLVDGVRLVHKKFLAQLERHGVTTFESRGEVFDPTRHEAVQQVPAELEAGRIVSEMQRGFILNDRLLRPALVTVSLGAPETQSEAPGADPQKMDRSTG